MKVAKKMRPAVSARNELESGGRVMELRIMDVKAGSGGKERFQRPLPNTSHLPNGSLRCPMAPYSLSSTVWVHCS